MKTEGHPRTTWNKSAVARGWSCSIRQAGGAKTPKRGTYLCAEPARCSKPAAQALLRDLDSTSPAPRPHARKQLRDRSISRTTTASCAAPHPRLQRPPDASRGRLAHPQLRGPAWPSVKDLPPAARAARGCISQRINCPRRTSPRAHDAGVPALRRACLRSAVRPRAGWTTLDGRKLWMLRREMKSGESSCRWVYVPGAGSLSPAAFYAACTALATR